MEGSIMIVNVITTDNIRQPDIDESIYSGWSVTADFGSTMEVEVTKRPEIVAKEDKALKTLAKLLLSDKIATLPDPLIEELKILLDKYDPTKTYEEGELVIKDDGKVEKIDKDNKPVKIK